MELRNAIQGATMTFSVVEASTRLMLPSDDVGNLIRLRSKGGLRAGSLWTHLEGRLPGYVEGCNTVR